MSAKAGREPTEYTGPPATKPPPPGWRVPTVVRPTPPRRLPHQDYASIDAAERQSRAVTKGIAVLAASVMFLVLLVVWVRSVS